MLLKCLEKEEIIFNKNVDTLYINNRAYVIDEERRFVIMEAFQPIKEQYRQIFLISHESEIK